MKVRKCLWFGFPDLLRYPAELDCDKGLMLYWIDPLDAADRLAAKLELTEKFYFHYERQESGQFPSKDRRNEHSVVPIQHW